MKHLLLGKQVSSKIQLHPDAVYAFGFSNGASLASMLAWNLAPVNGRSEESPAMAALRRTRLGGGVLLAVLSVGAASGTGAVLFYFSKVLSYHL